MIEKMHSDDIEAAPTCPELVQLSDKMTFTKATTLISPENLSRLTPQSQSCNSPPKFINLEDDIEKVEINSNSSSSSLDTDLLQDISAIPQENPTESVKNWLKKITEIQNGAIKKPQPPPTPSRVMKYQDLPYMGEITLDNSKPRRGRKPKKADICHLIYKNYGTIFPGTPNPNSYLEKSKQKPQPNKNHQVQNKIISSLLEKRLTQKDQNEPMNLCVRDLDHLKIRLPDVKSEPQSDDDVEILTPLPALNVKAELRATPDSVSTSDTDGQNSPGAGNYVYWPNTGLFIHPMALQQQLMMYQRLAGNMNYTLPSSHSPRPPPASTAISEPPEPLRKIVPKTVVHHHETKAKRNASASAGTSSDKTPAKRKRSAIFIPPIPAEATNPATEVSICKFKFTGGAKPSLQEKKMLSVDSGGNFRYYSGTGDKSMRGYEFFPRETLQQQIGNNAQGSSTGAFLQASGEKIYASPPVEIASSTSDFLLTPDLPAAIPQEQNVRNNKKRKSRKSVQREKLEKTFKEKGFLIQTQQLESAEGATYCKFRQLRKFTRYLFRSWKDYLPGNVRELSENEQLELQHAEQSASAAGLEIPDAIENLTGDNK
ncbi:unnamed protein product [Ceutorhynchus assimilis]|uniref:Uncharacterized protein n=1 Tax=Ceutorhynchus assimilis TaxID=467358 RepID=A0A9N9MP17_9CUCU|nr:unnamed protein product [Ceutorhynchus assimilis]